MIQGNLRLLDSKEEHNWVMYVKVPWDRYLKKKFKNKKEEFEAKTLHVKFKKGKGEDLLEILRRRQKSRMATKRFREHIRIVKDLKPNTSQG